MKMLPAKKSSNAPPRHGPRSRSQSNNTTSHSSRRIDVINFSIDHKRQRKPLPLGTPACQTCQRRQAQAFASLSQAQALASLTSRAAMCCNLSKRESISVMINGYAVKEYLRNNLTLKYCRAPPDPVKNRIPSNSWVVQATSPVSAVNIDSQGKKGYFFACRRLGRPSSAREGTMLQHCRPVVFFDQLLVMMVLVRWAEGRRLTK